MHKVLTVAFTRKLYTRHNEKYINREVKTKIFITLTSLSLKMVIQEHRAVIYIYAYIFLHSFKKYVVKFALCTFDK